MEPLKYSFFAIRTAALACCFSACLTIEEHYIFKRDGSGKMEYVVDMSELGELMEAFEGLNEEGEPGAPPDNDMLVFGDKSGRLKKIQGISGVKVNDKDPYKQKVRFKFKNIDALNKALNILIEDSSGVDHEYFTLKNGVITRDNDRHLANVNAGLNEEAEDDSASGEEMLRSMKYVFSMKFKDPIRTLDVAEDAEVTRDGTNTFHLTSDFWHISRDPKAMDMRITLDR